MIDKLYEEYIDLYESYTMFCWNAETSNSGFNAKELALVSFTKQGNVRPYKAGLVLEFETKNTCERFEIEILAKEQKLLLGSTATSAELPSIRKVAAMLVAKRTPSILQGEFASATKLTDVFEEFQSKINTFTEVLGFGPTGSIDSFEFALSVAQLNLV